MTRRSEGIEALASTNEVWINPEDAQELGVKEGEEVVVQSRRGAIRIRAKMTDSMPRKVLFIPFHFGESPANALTNTALDPVAKIPELKVAAVRVLTGKDAEGVEVLSLSSTG
ncbi:MAG: molybdopterin dinucleotide binding domain-containing protein, partial [Candidatus Geothermincolales bacterium]